MTEAAAARELVGWVRFDGDEYHSFQYATVDEERVMERSKTPWWRANAIPVYADRRPEYGNVAPESQA